MSTPKIVSLASIALVLAGCGAIKWNAQTNVNGERKYYGHSQTKEELEKARVAFASSKSKDAVLDFLKIAKAAFGNGAVERGEVESDLLLAECDAIVKGATITEAAERATVLRAEADVYEAGKKKAKAVELDKEAHHADPNLKSLRELLREMTTNDKEKLPAKVLEPLCKETRPTVDGEEDLYTLLWTCVDYSDAKTAEGKLKWASAADRAFYQTTKVRKEREERIAREQAAARRRAAGPCLAICASNYGTCSSQCGSGSGWGQCIGSCSSGKMNCENACLQ